MSTTHFEYKIQPTPCASCRHMSGARGEGATSTGDCRHPLVLAEAERRNTLPLPLRDALPPLLRTVALATTSTPRHCGAHELTPC